MLKIMIYDRIKEFISWHLSREKLYDTESSRMKLTEN